MLLFIVMPLLILGLTDSERSSREKRKLDPETFMNISEVIEYEGYPNEEYEILTNDGYYLTINRIPHGRKNPENTGSKLPVLVMPGIVTNGGIWVINLANNSLGFILADAGYDVWLANNRGSRWCSRHQNFSTDQEEFWNFSFHEMAMYDVPAIINFVLAKTGQEQIYYVGYSQGSTIGFIAFSAMPQLAQKIKIFFMFGPVHLLKHATSPYIKLSLLSDNFTKGVLGKKAVCSLPNHFTRTLVAKTCLKDFWNKICVKLIFSPGGISENNINVSRIGVFGIHMLDCSSVKCIIHWEQIIRSGEFRAFDYGSENIEKYNQTTPPLYNIKGMDIPTVVWSGGKDILGSPQDTKEFLLLLGNLIYHKEIPHWMHFDFLFGLDARQEMYDELVEIMEHFP